MPMITKAFGEWRAVYDRLLALERLLDEVRHDDAPDSVAAEEELQHKVDEVRKDSETLLERAMGVLHEQRKPPPPPN